MSETENVAVSGDMHVEQIITGQPDAEQQIRINGLNAALNIMHRSMSAVATPATLSEAIADTLNAAEIFTKWIKTGDSSDDQL
jgi:membrane carboxypeptidase/penicillin-binding protein PbpC